MQDSSVGPWVVQGDSGLECWWGDRSERPRVQAVQVHVSGAQDVQVVSHPRIVLEIRQLVRPPSAANQPAPNPPHPLASNNLNHIEKLVPVLLYQPNFNLPTVQHHNWQQHWYPHHNDIKEWRVYHAHQFDINCTQVRSGVWAEFDCWLQLEWQEAV